MLRPGHKQPLSGLLSYHEKETSRYSRVVRFRGLFGRNGIVGFGEIKPRNLEIVPSDNGPLSDLTALGQMAETPVLAAEPVNRQDIQKQVDNVAMIMRARRGRMGQS